MFKIKKESSFPIKTVTHDPELPKSYAYCSDTAYDPNIVPIIKGATTLYHEATFLEEHLHLCDKTKHSTASQAAKIARAAQVEKLIFGALFWAL